MSIEFKSEDGSLDRVLVELRQEIKGEEGDSQKTLTSVEFLILLAEHDLDNILDEGEMRIANRMGLIYSEDEMVMIPNWNALRNHLEILKRVFG